MPIRYPIPSGLNDTWDAARKALEALIGNVFDPKQNAVPPNIQGMDVGPMPGPGTGIPGMIAGGLMPETAAQAYESGMVGPMPLEIAANYRSPEAIQALRRAMAAENKARGSMSKSMSPAPASSYVPPGAVDESTYEFFNMNKPMSTQRGTLVESGPDPVDQILRGSWFHGMRGEARNTLESLENAKGGGREWFGGLKLPQGVADNWQNYQGIHSSIYPEFNLLRANEMGLPGSTHATPSYTRFGEPYGVSISASPSIAKNFSADDYIHRVQPLYGGPPTESIIPMWRPEGQKVMNEGYNTALNEWFNKDIGLSGSFPFNSRYGSPSGAFKQYMNQDYSDKNIENVMDFILSDLEKMKGIGGPSPTGEFNQLYSKALQAQGKRGILYSPQRYGEYEMLMLDPSYVRPLDYRKATDYEDPILKSIYGNPVNKSEHHSGYSQRKGFEGTPGSFKGYTAAQPEFATGATRLSDVFNQQSWVDRINEENKKRIMEMIDAQYREQVGNQLFGGR